MRVTNPFAGSWDMTNVGKRVSSWRFPPLDTRLGGAVTGDAICLSAWKLFPSRIEEALHEQCQAGPRRRLWSVIFRCSRSSRTYPSSRGVWAIFGHGNVAGLGEALQAAGDRLPTWRGHNEQGMAHAAIAFAKASNRRRAMAVTTSSAPGPRIW